LSVLAIILAMGEIRAIDSVPPEGDHTDIVAVLELHDAEPGGNHGVLLEAAES
jgi:hypothetical protein